MDNQKGVIAWFANNSVAANLLMILLIAGGLFSALLINKEVFPSFDLNYLHISVSYPGAAPQEIEEGINIKIEEAIKDVDGISNITSIAANGVGTIKIEVSENYQPKDVLDEVKLRIDSISSFPNNIEKPNIYQLKRKSRVLWVSVYGDLNKTSLKEMAKSIRDDITALPGVTQANINGIRDYEISIEVSENKLREYQLTFSQVAKAVQNAAIDLPGGTIKTAGGDILLRTNGLAYTGDDFSHILVTSLSDGSRIMLPQVATINDAFEEQLEYSRFNGKRAINIEVSSVDNQNALDISKQVNQYIINKNSTLPDSVKLDVWGDMTHYLTGRLNMMLSNMFYGAIFVFLMLALFLDLKLAFWVMMGLPVCFLGTLLLMPLYPFSLSINVLTLFAFILVLGVVVDDAIVIGESAYTEIEKKGHSINNIIRGTKKVAIPATFGVLTTIAAFIPMVMISGSQSAIWQSIGLVVILCLIFSLIESKLILPAHLARIRIKNKQSTHSIMQLKQKFNDRVQYFIHHQYRQFILTCIHYRYNVVASFIGILILSIALVISGKVRWVFFPNLPSDFIQMNLEMEDSSAEKNTLNAVQQIENALYKVNDELNKRVGSFVIKHSMVTIESRTSAKVVAELTKGENRKVDGIYIANLWRNNIPDLPFIKKLEFNASTKHGKGDIAFKLQSNDLEQLAQAANVLKNKLKQYQGVYDIADNFSSTSNEIKLTITPEAQALGLTLADLAKQVRYGFYGFEAQRILRDKEEVKVMVRYPREERQTLGYLENMQINTPQGFTMPFSQAAKIELTNAMTSITRIDGVRAITITANTDKNKIDPSKVVKDLKQQLFPQLKKSYSQVNISLDGESLDESQAIVSLVQGFFFALFTIYALMAIPLKSYSQPLIIMSVIPFGIIGAIMGHFILGLSINILSMMGIVALAGVVVNDSLILVDVINKSKHKGEPLITAVTNGACHRFRAILLTSLTTFVGLVPILLEKSLQAKIVIPMATSLAFGILFSTLVTLILVPMLYIILNDIKKITTKLFVWYWYGSSISK